MKVKVPRDYHQMSQSQKKRIENYIVEMATGLRENRKSTTAVLCSTCT